jgi:hypothetical protein
MSPGTLPTTQTLDELAHALRAQGIAATLIIAPLTARLDCATPADEEWAAQLLGLDDFEPAQWHRHPRRFIERQLIDALESWCCAVGSHVN